MAFTSPNYTQIPNELLGRQDEPGAMVGMGEAELKITLALCRLTFGFHREEVKASLSILERMTGLSRRAVIDATEAAVKRGFIERLPTAPNTCSEWRVVKPVYQAAETSKQGSLATSKVSSLDSPKTSEPSTLMKETDSKETLKETPSHKNGDGDKGGVPAGGMTRDEGYLPTAEDQMEMLIPQAARIDEAHTATLQDIERSTWRIGGDVKDALVEFMVATHLGLPRPPARKDWLDSLTYQVHEYGVTQLRILYPATVHYMRNLNLTYTRPGSLTASMAKVAAELKTAPKERITWEWKSVKPF